MCIPICLASLNSAIENIAASAQLSASLMVLISFALVLVFAGQSVVLETKLVTVTTCVEHAVIDTVVSTVLTFAVLSALRITEDAFDLAKRHTKLNTVHVLACTVTAVF